MSNIMAEQLVRATLAKFEAERQEAIAVIELYLNHPTGVADHPNIVEDIALESKDASLDGDKQSQEEIDAMTDLEEESIYDVEVLKEIREEQEGFPNVEE